MNYDVDFFLNKFKAIPEDEWCINKLFDDYGRKCVNALCGIMSYEERTNESHALFLLFKDFKVTPNEEVIPYRYATCKEGSTNYGNYSPEAANICDGYTLQYKQATPRLRIIAALQDKKKRVERKFKKYALEY